MKSLTYLLATVIVVAKSQFIKRDPKIEGYMFNLTQSKFNYTNPEYKNDIGSLETLFDAQQVGFVADHKEFIKSSEKERDDAKKKLTSLELKELDTINSDLND